jgi:phage shock protein C
MDASFPWSERNLIWKHKEAAMDTTPFGQKIADLRRRKGFSQDGLAYLCKVDVRTIQRIETGRVAPRPSTLKLISEVLGPMPVSEPRDDRGGSIDGFRETLGRWTSGFRNPKGEDDMKKQNMLQQLARSRKDRKIAGICGGLGEHTDVPAWFWRLAFIAAVFAHGAGALVYFGAWIFMPQAKEPAGKPRLKTANWLQLLTRSVEDRKLGGVCGGLGAASAIPSWLWRMGFVAAVFFYGAGIILYALLWISIPRAEPARARR